MNEHQFYGHQRIDIIRDKIREAYAAGDIANYLRLSFLLSNALHSAQERRAA